MSSSGNSLLYFYPCEKHPPHFPVPGGFTSGTAAMRPSVVTCSLSVPRKKDMKFEADITKSIPGTPSFPGHLRLTRLPAQRGLASSRSPCSFRRSGDPHGRSQRRLEQLLTAVALVFESLANFVDISLLLEAAWRAGFISRYPLWNCLKVPGP